MPDELQPLFLSLKHGRGDEYKSPTRRDGVVMRAGLDRFGLGSMKLKLPDRRRHPSKAYRDILTRDDLIGRYGRAFDNIADDPERRSITPPSAEEADVALKRVSSRWNADVSVRLVDGFSDLPAPI